MLKLNTHNGTTDIFVVNTGTTSAPLPSIEVSGEAAFIEPLHTYIIDFHDKKAYFRSPKEAVIDAGAAIPVGWVRGDTSITIHLLTDEAALESETPLSGDVK
jgi:hypothetical protein